MANSSNRKKSLGSYPSSNVIFSITTALFMIGLFVLFTLNASLLTQKLKEEIEVQVLLTNGVTPEEIEVLRELLEKQEYISKMDDKPLVRYRSKQAWAKEMEEETGEDFVDFLGENPLRDALLINIRYAFYNAETMEQIKADLEGKTGVFEVVYAEQLVSKINANITRIGVVLSFFIAIFLVTVVVLIHNAIRLTLFSQRFLIRSMQLVGATALFIKKPFLVRAWWQGCLSGLFASLLLAILLFYALQQIEELNLLQNYILNVLIFLGLMILGGAVSASSAYLAINRYLKMKLEELY